MSEREYAAKGRMLWPVAAVMSCFLVGSTAGCVFAVTVSGESAQQLKQYLTDYTLLARDIVYTGSLMDVLWTEGRWFLICVLCGMTGYGMILLPVALAARGFLFSFGIASFVRFLGGRGIVPACVIFGLPALFWIPGLFLNSISGTAAIFSIMHLRKKGMTVRCGMGRKQRTGIVLGFCFLILYVVVESFLMPGLISISVRTLTTV